MVAFLGAASTHDRSTNRESKRKSKDRENHRISGIAPKPIIAAAWLSIGFVRDHNKQSPARLNHRDGALAWKIDWSSQRLRRSLVKIRVHTGKGSRFSQLLFEHLSHVRILVVIFYLITARLDVLIDFSDVA